MRLNDAAEPTKASGTVSSNAEYSGVLGLILNASLKKGSTMMSAEEGTRQHWGQYVALGLAV